MYAVFYLLMTFDKVFCIFSYASLVELQGLNKSLANFL